MIDNRGFEKEGDGSREFLKGSCGTEGGKITIFILIFQDHFIDLDLS